MPFTSVHPPGLPTQPPAAPLPPISTLTANTNVTSITRFIFSSSAIIEDKTTYEGEAWQSFLDGLWVGPNVKNVYWGWEEAGDTQSNPGEGGKRIVLAVERRRPIDMPNGNSDDAEPFAALLPYMLRDPDTTSVCLEPFTHLALGWHRGLTSCKVYRLSPYLPPARLAEIPQIRGYEVQGLMPRDASALGKGWGVEGYAGGWVIGTEEENGEQAKEYMTTINWGAGDGKEGWENSVEGRRITSLWDERAIAEQKWAARMRVQSRDKPIVLSKEFIEKAAEHTERVRLRRLENARNED